MLITHIKKEGNRQLIILFLGWSAEPATIGGFDLPGYDLSVVHDYRDATPSTPWESLVAPYEGFSVVAWSFGVWHAEQQLSSLPRSPRLTLAINGTTQPIDDQWGIPCRAFTLTLRSIRTQGIEGFNRRMCGDFFPRYTPSQRSIGELADELQAIATRIDQAKPFSGSFRWDYALIGEKDRIFPPENLFRFWEKRCTFVVSEPDLPHYPFTERGIARLTEIFAVHEQPR